MLRLHIADSRANNSSRARLAVKTMSTATAEVFGAVPVVFP